LVAVVRQCFQLISHGRRWRWAALILLALVASGLEMFGAALVYALVALVSDPGSSIDLPLVGDLRDLAGDTDERTLLLSVAVLMAVFFLLRAVAQVSISYVQQRVAHREGARLAKRLIAGYLALPYAFHLQRNTADLIRNVNGAVNNVVNQAFIPIIHVGADLILVLGLLTVMVLVSPAATATAILVVGGSAAVLLVVVQPRLKRLGSVSHRMGRTTLKALQQALHGLRDVKLLGRERAFAHVYAHNRDQLARAQYLHGTAVELPRHVMETALVGFILLFFGFAVAQGLATEQVLSTLGLFAYAGLRLQPSLTRTVRGLNSLKYGTAAIEEVHHEIGLVEGLQPPGEQPDRPFRSSIEVRDVRFRYEGTETDVLSDIDLTIGRGQTIGIVGSTGSGKTTLVDLLTGLLEPTGGEILVDGRPLSEDVRGWQRNLGVVPQMVFLTDDTLRRNIALGVPDDRIDSEAIEEAIELAQLREFVERLPDGLETSVGERGVRVSGGQRQRVAIARALYRRASILVFDEGTSALDNRTEAELMSALERLRGNHTIILVAHRLSTVRNCDKVVFTSHGRIEGLGSYDELLAGSEQFRALATNT
jgi:ATP-binding cassette, subfamily B, bacterial PglK